MTYTEPNGLEPEAEERPAPPAPLTRNATWRFLGERLAADQAYCVRFGVAVAPEPFVAPGGAWAYELPDSTAGR